jgi:hypothetical protein
LSKKLALLTQNKAKLCKNLIITLVFEKNANFSDENRKNRENNIDPQMDKLTEQLRAKLRQLRDENRLLREDNRRLEVCRDQLIKQLETKIVEANEAREMEAIYSARLLNTLHLYINFLCIAYIHISVI